MAYYPKTRGGIARRLGCGRIAAGDTQFVYLLSSCGYVKVGRAKNIDLRIRQLQGGCPEEIVPVVAFGPVDKRLANSIEREIHARMALRRSYGEWFSCDIEPAVALLALIGSSCIGAGFFVFGNEHDVVVSECLSRESRCRGGEDAEASQQEVHELLSCFQNGKGVLVRRKNRVGEHMPEPLDENGNFVSKVLM
jgi:hypothetical protein